jgi:hypothetical protein
MVVSDEAILKHLVLVKTLSIEEMRKLQAHNHEGCILNGKGTDQYIDGFTKGMNIAIETLTKRRNLFENKKGRLILRE